MDKNNTSNINYKRIVRTENQFYDADAKIDNKIQLYLNNWLKNCMSVGLDISIKDKPA